MLILHLTFDQFTIKVGGNLSRLFILKGTYVRSRNKLRYNEIIPMGGVDTTCMIIL